MASRLIGYGKKFPNFTVINVNAAIFHNSGGSAVHELAFALSSAAEYLERLTGMGHTAEEVAENIRFTFATGSNYFMEIAKFRAARYLWSKMLEAWEINPEIAGKLDDPCSYFQMEQNNLRSLCKHAALDYRINGCYSGRRRLVNC
jgi:methylmalonyl-CoA mutase N-terminal domain/subunit